MIGPRTTTPPRARSRSITPPRNIYGPSAGWLKLLESLSRGRWAWKPLHFTIQPPLLVYSSEVEGAPLGIVPLAVVTALRCGSTGGTAGSSSDLTIVFNADDMLRLRAPSPAHAQQWLQILREACAKASPTGATPPTSSPKDEEAAGGRGIEAAALTADDPTPFPAEALVAPAPAPVRGMASPPSVASPPATTSNCNRYAAPTVASSVSSPPQPTYQNPPPSIPRADSREAPSCTAPSEATARSFLSSKRSESSAKGSTCSFASNASSSSVHNIRPARRDDAQYPWQKAEDLADPLHARDGPVSYVHRSRERARTPSPEHEARRSPDYGGRFGAHPWPTAPVGRDRRPTHERYSYSPSINEVSKKIGKRQGNITERLYTQGSAKKDHRARMMDALDLNSFDYALKAGLDEDGSRASKEYSHKAISRTHEENLLQDENYTFSPMLLESSKKRNDAAAALGVKTIPSEDLSGKNRIVWERLHGQAATHRTERQRLEEAAENEAIVKAGSFAPELTQRAKELKREGFVEDRLIDAWARRLVAAEERAIMEREEEMERLREEAQSALQSVHGVENPNAAGSSVRKKVEEKRQIESDASGPLHERLHASAAEAKKRIEHRKKSVEASELYERWDGSKLKPGEIKITRRASSIGASGGGGGGGGGGGTPSSTTPMTPMTPAANAPMAAPDFFAQIGAAFSGSGKRTPGSKGGGGGAPNSGEAMSYATYEAVRQEGLGLAAHERLHKHGSSLLQHRLSLDQSWDAIVAERLSGKAGTPARSEKAVTVEADACDRLWQKAQEQQLRQKEREKQANAEPPSQHPKINTKLPASVIAARTPPANLPPSQPSVQKPDMRASVSSTGSIERVHPIEISDVEARSKALWASPGESATTATTAGVAAAAASKGGGVSRGSVSRDVAETRGAQMHFEAMVRMQQKEELILSAKMAEEAHANEKIRRTSISASQKAAAAAAAASVGKLYGGERLYQQSKEQQAKLERQGIERQQQLLEKELESSTFHPQVTSRAAKMRTDGRPVEERMADWYEAKQAKHSEAMAQSASAMLPAKQKSRGSTTGPRVGDPHHLGTKARTVEDF